MYTITEYIAKNDYKGLVKDYGESEYGYMFIVHQRYIAPISDTISDINNKYGEFFDKSIDEEGRISSVMRSHIRTIDEGVVIRESINCHFGNLKDALEYLNIFIKKGYKLFENLEITKISYMV